MSPETPATLAGDGPPLQGQFRFASGLANAAAVAAIVSVGIGLVQLLVSWPTATVTDRAWERADVGIVMPLDGSSIASTDVAIEAVTSTPDRTHFVVVRASTSQWHVQREPLMIGQDGRLHGTATLGSADVGEGDTFEIAIVVSAGVTPDVREGIAALPHSGVVQVVRAPQR